MKASTLKITSRDREIRGRGTAFEVADDRDEQVQLIDPVTIDLLGRFRGDASLERLEKVRQLANVRTARAQKIRLPFYLLILGITGVCAAYGLVIMWSPTSAWQVALNVVLAIIGGVAFWQGLLSLSRSMRIRYARRIMNAMAQEGLCCSCGYDLWGLPTESDGCVVCPECGAAWKASEPV